MVLARCTRFNNWPSVAHWDQTKKIKNQVNQELGMERPHISYFLLFLKLDLLQLFFPGLDRGFCRYFLTKLNFSLRLTGQYRMPPFKFVLFSSLFLDSLSVTKCICIGIMELSLETNIIGTYRYRYSTNMIISFSPISHDA